ncbi:MAG: UDP-glucose 4-epimerase GalE [Deltaproteobacteria bacterium]|nr:UDP-glucose 4-epimerase GalE [Deltaproteobacteria bacterium]
MKILVVGGAGYIGSHMVRELIDKGFDPLVYDNLSTGHSWAVPEGSLIEGDLADTAALNRLFETVNIRAVMHFASSIQVAESVVEPLKYYRNNVANTLNLLAAMRQNGVKRIVFSSTAAVYGSPLSVPISEQAPLNPENPYGRSKLMVEQVLADCDHAWGLKSAVLRYFNAAGAHPSAAIGEAHTPESHLIPIMLQVASGRRESVTIYGTDYPTRDGTCIRDYIHVCDLASAHSLALEALLDDSGSFVCNLGNGLGYSIQEVMEVGRAVTGHPIPVSIGQRRPGDPALLVASADKMRSEFGWKPRFADLPSIIGTAWKWHQNNGYGF